MNMTEKQSNFLELLAGIGVAAGVWLSLWFSSIDSVVNHGDNKLLQWLFIVIFAAGMFGRRAIENKKGIVLKLYMKAMLIAMIIGFGLFILAGFFVPVANGLALFKLQ